MERLSESKLGYYVSKLAARNDHGLTNAQLMLTNDDLKPGTSMFTVFPFLPYSFTRTLTGSLRSRA